jgi:hypothetical protein
VTAAIGREVVGDSNSRKRSDSRGVPALIIAAVAIVKKFQLAKQVTLGF